MDRQVYLRVMPQEVEEISGTEIGFTYLHFFFPPISKFQGLTDYVRLGANLLTWQI